MTMIFSLWILNVLDNQVIVRHNFDWSAAKKMNHWDDTGTAIQKDTLPILYQTAGSFADSQLFIIMN